MPNDDINLKTVHFKDLNTYRYCEIFLVGGNKTAGVYNTTGENESSASSRDSAPQALMEGIDTEALKKQLDVLGVAINGPKQWMLDWIDIPIGAERNFNGLKAVWCAVLSLKTFNPKEHIPYSHHHNCP